MLARADSPGIQAFRPPRRRRFRPGRGRKTRRKRKPKPPFSPAPALARLDAIVRENPPWAGVFRQRLALERRRRKRAPGRPRAKTRRRCATRSTSAGPAAIPDPQEGACWPGGSLTPASDPASGGPRLSPPPRCSGSPHDEALQEAVEAAEACAAGARLAPFAAARAFALASAR